MGLIKEIVLAPAAPVRFTFWVARKVADQAEREHYSTGAGVRRLQEIEQALDEGSIDPETAEELETKVLEEQLGATVTGPEGQVEGDDD